MKVRARFLKTDLILLRSPVMLRKLDCSRNKTLYNSISNEKLVMQTLDLLELTLAKLHLWSAVSSRQPYLKKKKLQIFRRQTFEEENKILKEQVFSIYSSLRKSGKLGDSVLQNSKAKLRKSLNICFFKS